MVVKKIKDGKRRQRIERDDRKFAQEEKIVDERNKLRQQRLDARLRQEIVQHMELP